MFSYNGDAEEQANGTRGKERKLEDVELHRIYLDEIRLRCAAFPFQHLFVPSVLHPTFQQRPLSQYPPRTIEAHDGVHVAGSPEGRICSIP